MVIVFLQDEYTYGMAGKPRPVDERIIAHEIVLDDDDRMF